MDEEGLETYVVAIGILPVLAGIHRSDPRDSDVVLWDSLEHCTVQSSPITSKVSIGEPLSGFYDLSGRVVNEL